MDAQGWPSCTELNEIRERVSKMANVNTAEVRVVVSPYRICPLGAHIDHQGGTVLAMTINKGILLGFAPSANYQVVIHSGQFQGEIKFRSVKGGAGNWAGEGIAILVDIKPPISSSHPNLQDLWPVLIELLHTFLLPFSLGLFLVDETQQPKDKCLAKDSSELHEQCDWGRYARGAVYALQSRGNNLSKVRYIARGSLFCSSPGYAIFRLYQMDSSFI
ncbi:hypothetical protein V8G54_002989 [Vigna mungo]|uniref:Galactokinase N-terminal domain-containing protein n=1 Tax=Vigna mungo TaxID=3915 RepID=A0AAQ3PBA7_VIGMU